MDSTCVCDTDNYFITVFHYAVPFAFITTQDITVYIRVIFKLTQSPEKILFLLLVIYIYNIIYILSYSLVFYLVKYKLNDPFRCNCYPK